MKKENERVDIHERERGRLKNIDNNIVLIIS
jgi:hypothetical protein